MIRKHNRRAAKAAFTIALGVALVLGLAAAAPAAQTQTTPIIVGAKNFPEQYVLGQLYRQALIAKGFEVQYKENIGSTELADTALKSGQITLYPEYTGIMLVGHVQAEVAAEDRGGDVQAREAAVRAARADAPAPDAVPGPRRARGHAGDGEPVRPQDASRT